MNKKQLGLIGENLACKHLQNQGYRILAQNYTCQFGEIDLIATESKNLVFIEVKTRWSERFGRPEEAVTRHKINQIQKVGFHYKNSHPDLPDSFRIDVVAVLLSASGELERLELFRNITAP